MTKWQNWLAMMIGISPAVAFAAAPVYFDLGGLIFIVLAAALGLALVLASLVRRNVALAVVGLSLIVGPSALSLISDEFRRRSRDTDARIAAQDEREHGVRFAAFCSGPKQPIHLLSEGTMKGRRALLSVTCNDKGKGYCYSLDARLVSEFGLAAPGCARTAAVGAVWREIPGYPPLVVPVCGAESRAAESYAPLHLSIQERRSLYSDGKGPFSRRGFFELEMTLIDAEDAKPLGTAVFFARSLNYDRSSDCPSFENTAVELVQAALPKH